MVQVRKRRDGTIATAAGAFAVLLAWPSLTAAQEPDAACVRTVLAYARAWDRGDAAGFEALFTPEASLDLGAGPVVGRPAISALFARRMGTATTRHFMSNIEISPLSPDEATGVSYVQLFAGPQTESGVGPILAQGYTMAGEYQDRFDTSSGTCRFIERKLLVIFRRPPS